MADPVDLILDFLKRHNFEKAALAFKAELSDREHLNAPVLSSENVSDWDLQLRSPSVESVSTSVKTSPVEGQMTSRSSAEQNNSIRDEKESDETPPGRVISPPEKQLYVEYEPGKLKTQESLVTPRNEFSFENAVRMSPDPESTVPLKAAYVSSPIYEVETAMPALDPSSSAVMQSSSFLLRPTDNQAWQPNGDLDDRSSKKGNEVVHRQQIAMNIPPFESLAGLSSRAQIQQLAQMEPLHSECVSHLDDKGDVNCKNLAPLNVKHDIKNSGKCGQSSNQNEHKVPVSSFAANKGHLLEEQLIPDGSQVNSFMARGTSAGHFKAPPLKTLLPIPFLQYDEQQKTSVPEFSKGSGIQKVLIANPTDTEKVQFCKESIARSGIAEHTAHSGNLDSTLNNSQSYEELPRLPPVRLHLIGKNTSVLENGVDTIESNSYRKIDSALEVALGWPASTDDPATSGSKRIIVRPSVSQGIVDAVSDQLSGFTIAADGQSERWYPDEYCDSDSYEDDDDPGYIRQPIEDEEWFLTHEIDYPSDNERPKRHADLNVVSMSSQAKKLDEDDRSFVEEESYFSGEEYYRAQAAKKELYNSQQAEALEPTFPNLYDNNPLALATVGGGGYDYGSRPLENQELSLVSCQPVWKGFIGQPKQIGEQADLVYTLPGSPPDAGEDDNHCSVVSGGIQANSDAADIGSEVRESLLGASSECDTESVREQEIISYGPLHDPKRILSGRHVEEKSAPVQHLEEDDERDMILQYFDEAWGHVKRGIETGDGSKPNMELKDKTKEQSKKKHLMGHSHKVIPDNDGFVFEGFSFPSPSSTGEVAASTAGSGKSIWSNRESPGQAEENDAHVRGMVGPDDTLAAWKRKSSNSSPILGSSEEHVLNRKAQHHSTDSLHSTDEFVSLETREPVNDESDVPLPQAVSKPFAQEEDDALGGQEEFRPVGVDEDQYEIFDLRIIHRKNRTGFEEEKDFPVVINSVVAGRYHVTEYLGSAAFSKAIQAHDLHTGMDVCMKIIKNNKDFFDQSLDEIKLLKYVNKHDPADKHHILRLYDYFYHQEHLFIVCELLRANLYEFHKFNRESGGEVYFTMPRLQSITRQCLEGLEFLHSLGIIHCDLKPENILVKSYSRCEIKIIDLGSSCFQTDHLCSYVQSRSYRAPEVILGLPYDKKIDIWSLGCILAELCTGNVLFQNDSLATLLARVVGIIGPIDPEILANGRDTHKYFTKNHMLYERNQETDQLEYLLPKKTSLKHRLPMGDAGFIEFVRYLLQSNPAKRPTATEALQHPWLSFPYEPISS